MRIVRKRRIAASVLIAAGTLALASGPASAACGDAAASGVDWSGCDKTGVDLTDANLSSSTLTGTDFGGAELLRTTFTGASGVGADFTASTLVVPGGTVDSDRLITFTDSDFTNGKFNNANMMNAYFLRANLNGADFSGANIVSAVFVGADLGGATFDAGANVTGTNFQFTPSGDTDTEATPFETPVNIDVLTNDENFNGTLYGQTFLPVNVSDPANGSVVVETNGTITYTPDDDFDGADSFTYQPQSVLPAAWALPTAVTKVSTGAAVTVNVTVGVAPTDPILSGKYIGMSGIEGRIARLYAAYFGRNPDDGGFAFWKEKIEAGLWTNDDASTFFSESPEFVATYGANLTDQQYLTLVYNNVLGRDPEPGGNAFWLDKLATGTSRGTVMLQFSDSAEFRSRTQTS